MSVFSTRQSNLGTDKIAAQTGAIAGGAQWRFLACDSANSDFLLAARASQICPTDLEPWWLSLGTSNFPGLLLRHSPLQLLH